MNFTKAVFLLTHRDAASYTLVVQLHREQFRHDISVTDGTQESNTTGKVSFYFCC